MADLDLLEWAAQQPDWVRDALRRIATATGFAIGGDDRAAVAERIQHAAVGRGDALACETLTSEHLQKCAEAEPRAILASIGPLQNVDRLARNQQLRFAPVGITLIFGENGSGKSGYARIAKCLCRSLSADQLKGDVFKEKQEGATEVKLRYQTGNDPIIELDWTPVAKPPAALKQISVFDSKNARLYVDQQNHIAYLPAEVAVLERHGELCASFGAEFRLRQDAIERRLKTPLPAGYTPEGTIARFLARLDPRSRAVPSKEEIEKLAGLSEAEVEELRSLERKLVEDPIAMAATRRRASLVLTRLVEVLKEIEDGLSDGIADQLDRLATEARTTAQAVELAATSQFSGEPLAGVGGEAWRLLYLAARDFAAFSGGSPERIADQVGDLCPLCQSPMVAEAAARMSRFNGFIHSEASRRADAAREALTKAVRELENVAIPPVDVVSGSLAGYASLSPNRAEALTQIEALLQSYASRRKALLDRTSDAAHELPPLSASQRQVLSDEIERLSAEATQMEASATRAAALDADRARVAELKDRSKLGDDLPTILQRADELEELAALKKCQAQVQTRGISLQISALRRKLVTDNLQKRIQAEITNLDLNHIPFRVIDSSEQGQSRFAVGLQGVDKIPNQQILSEGEQRALALACFLAEVGNDGDAYGLIIDDPVSSLDQRRIRLVAKRLVQEAAKGRQVVIFTHNLVFFNEVASEAAHVGDTAPLVKMVVRKTEADGFGVIDEDTEPWLARSVSMRLADLRTRAQALARNADLNGDYYRRQAKDFYSDLRETWERCVEEIVLNQTVQRLVPDVMTLRLKGVIVSDDDYKTIYFAMKHVSERSGHDMPTGRDIPVPPPDEMLADILTLENFQINYKKRRKAAETAREAMHEHVKATLV